MCCTFLVFCCTLASLTSYYKYMHVHVVHTHTRFFIKQCASTIVCISFYVMRQRKTKVIRWILFIAHSLNWCCSVSSTRELREQSFIWGEGGSLGSWLPLLYKKWRVLVSLDRLILQSSMRY